MQAASDIIKPSPLKINFLFSSLIMDDHEGIVKYKLKHHHKAINPTISISELTTWRTILFDLEFIGQIQARYEGLGFGNISQRIKSNTPNSESFLITGSQTGGIRTLNRQHYCTVLSANPYLNIIDSEGETKPSSESLTHASIYQHDNNIQAIVHTHCPEIWNNTTPLNLPYTASNITYGTVEMATQVARLLNTENLQEKKIFSMLGHKDGIIAFSGSIESAAQIIIDYYAKSLTLDQN